MSVPIVTPQIVFASQAFHAADKKLQRDQARYQSPPAELPCHKSGHDERNEKPFEILLCDVPISIGTQICWILLSLRDRLRRLIELLRSSFQTPAPKSDL
jgi:hypothetical protein